MYKIEQLGNTKDDAVFYRCLFSHTRHQSEMGTSFNGSKKSLKIIENALQNWSFAKYFWTAEQLGAS